MLPQLAPVLPDSLHRAVADRNRGNFFVSWLGLFCLLISLAAMQSTFANPINSRSDRILIKPKPDTDSAALGKLHAANQARVMSRFRAMGDLQILSLPQGASSELLLARYRQSGLVEFAEPDYLGHTAATPNDPAYTNGTLWALNNVGQNGGTTNADIDAPEAWDVLNSASNIVVAVLDTGVRYTHEDLSANMWVSPQDGSPGFNALTGTNDPSDDSGHGTRVAGILGAAGNNGKGVVGVAWQVQIMACKCFNNFGVGSISDVITCMDFAQTNGAKIINASWGFGTNSLALSNAIYSARSAGIIVVAAAGNSSNNLDVVPSYPTGYHLDNVVTVAYTTRNDTLAGPSNYGATNVHLAAPGDQIYSTFGATDNFYDTESGSSFAAPYVTGTFALMLAKFPAENYTQLISRVLNATDPLPSLAGKCVTGGRLNLRKALSPPILLTTLPPANNGAFRLQVAAGPNRSCMVQSATLLTNWVTVFSNVTSTNGTFTFTDTQSTNIPRRYYRAISSP